jgi:hypothetical protein
VPAAADVAPWLTWLAAAGLIITIVGAIATHGRRREVKDVAVNVAIAAVLSLVVWGRVGLYAF